MATPFMADTVVVPPNVPELTEATIDTVLEVTTLPDASFTVMTG